jgi:hypothetical protein
LSFCSPAVSLAAALFISAAVASADAGAGDQASSSTATSSLHVAATFAPRSSLQVSTRVLTFHVTDAASAEASLDFTAGTRIPSGTAVELIADADVPSSGQLTLVAGPEGTIPTSLESGTPTAIAHWSGSGLRTGRLTLRLNAPPGVYNIPIALGLSTGTAD